MDRTAAGESGWTAVEATGEAISNMRQPDAKYIEEILIVDSSEAFHTRNTRTNLDALYRPPQIRMVHKPDVGEFCI